MNTPPQDYRRKSHARLPHGGLLETRLRRDGRRASLVLDGLVLEVGRPEQIARRYRDLARREV